MERLHDACGVVGIYTNTTAYSNEQIDVRSYLTLALTALQHRGQESAGMAVYTEQGQIASRIEMGKVREVFADSGKGLPQTHCGIGHVRSSITSGGFPGNVSRILPANTQAIIETRAWQVPPLFQLIARLGKVECEEMYRTFTMGVGMVLVLAPEAADKARVVLPELLTVGHIAEGNGVIVS